MACLHDGGVGATTVATNCAWLMANERKRGGDFTLRFAWRLLLLFAIGTLHAWVYRGDILQVLAAVGLVMIPFDRLRSDKAALVMLDEELGQRGPPGIA